MNRLIYILILIFSATQLSAGPNCGHDHGDEKKVEKKVETKEDHSGHDHSKHKGDDKDHSGHDHSKHKGDDKDHSGHDHSKHKDDDKDHSGHDHSKHKDDDEDHSGHDHGDEEGAHIELTEAMIKRVGIKTAKVSEEPVTAVITVPGEIQFNDDNITHIIPSYPSKAINVNVRQGQYVRKGTVLATLTNRETLSRYTIKAPRGGRVITKHLSAGEVVSDSDTLFTIANLSTVWAEFAVPQDRLDGISGSSKMSIALVNHEEERAIATVNYISPVTDPLTRRVTVRAVVNNASSEFRPGSYVTARIDYGKSEPVVAVEFEAVQSVGGEKVLFVPVEGEKGAFTTKPVIVGRSNSRYYEILSGIKAGETYVTDGAFSLKAQMVTADMDPHAGHNH